MGGLVVPLIGAIAGPLISGLFGGGQQQQQQIQYAPPAPVIVKPPPAMPEVSKSGIEASKKIERQGVMAATEQEFQALLKRARQMGMPESSVSEIEKTYPKFREERMGQTDKLLDIKAESAQLDADYKNKINEQNFQTQLASIRATQPQYQPPRGNAIGPALGGLASAAMGVYGRQPINIQQQPFDVGMQPIPDYGMQPMPTMPPPQLPQTAPNWMQAEGS